MARPTRKEQLKAERRKQRGGETGLVGQRLAVPKDKLDPNFEYRWLNDKPGRIPSMTGEWAGWELVEDATIKGEESDGSTPSVVVGTGEDGKGMRAYLARKPKDVYEVDQELKAEQLDEQMAEIKRGQAHTTAPEAQALQGTAYTPSGGITINENRR